MKDSREIIPARPVERRDLERPVEVPFNDGGVAKYRTDVNQAGNFQLFEYWRAVRKRLWLVVGIAVLATTLTALYMSRKPNEYRATSTIQVDLEQTNPELLTSESRRPTGTADPAYFNTQLQLLTSDNLLRRVVKDKGLENNPTFVQTAFDSNISTTQMFLRYLNLATKEEKKESRVLEESTGGDAKSVDEMKEALRVLPFVTLLKHGLIVEPVRESRSSYKDTRLIEISFQHSNPNLAALVVNGVAEVFSVQNQEKRSKSSSETSTFLESQVADYQTKIKEDEQSLVNLSRDASVLKVNEEQTIVLQGLSDLYKQLLFATSERQKAESKYKAAMRTQDSLTALADKETQGDLTLREGSSRSLEMQLRPRVEDATAERQQLLAEFTPEAPEVQAYDNKIKSLQRAIDENRVSGQKDIETYRKRAKEVISNVFLSEYERTKSQEAKVKADYDRLYNQAQVQNGASINLRILEDRLKTNKEFLDSLLKTQRENNVVASGTENNVSVVGKALPSDTPVGPRRLITVGVAFILSTLFGAGLALFLEYLDDTLRSTEEVENYLQLPALAAIPTIDNLTMKRLLLVGNNANLNEQTQSLGTRNQELLIHSDSRSSLAEAYRQLRTSILLSTAGHAPKSLLVTSSLPSEGKTTTAVNTAISLAQTGATVLIIDADMRRPRLHGIFGIPNGVGLSSVLSSDMSTEDVLSHITYDDETKLHVLPSGPVPPNPAELLGSDQMRKLLKGMEGHFTHVVVDSPPIASFTDGVLIGSIVDGVILVVHSGKSSRQVVRRSKQFLNDVGAKIFGVVLNNANLRTQDDYYYQSYYYRGGYYRHEDDQQ